MTSFDSNEEQYFDWWLQELKEAGFIKEIIHQPEPFQLSEQLNVSYFEPYKKKEGGKYVNEEIIAGHVYTTDVLVIWDHKAINVLVRALDSLGRKKKNRSFQFIICQYKYISDKYYSYIEVKPVFDQNNMTRLAKINQKWVWEKHGEFVNIIIPEKHFEKTFTPKRYLTTNLSGKARKIKYKNVVTLEEFLKKKSLS